MDELEYLKSVQKVLKEHDFKSKVFQPSKKTPLPFLAIQLPRDKRWRKRVLIMTATEQITDLDSVPGNLREGSPILFLDFVLNFPFKIKSKYSGEVAKFLHLLNHQLNTYGFGLRDGDCRVYYRFCTYATTEGIDNRVLIGVVTTVMYTYDLYFQIIEKVGKGWVSYESIVHDFSESSSIPK